MEEEELDFEGIPACEFDGLVFGECAGAEGGEERGFECGRRRWRRGDHGASVLATRDRRRKANCNGVRGYPN